MLSKQYRLTKDKDFAKVAQQGQGVFSRELGLKWMKNNLPYSRFGIIVSLKVSKKAVVRNKIKRRIRAILKKNLSKITKGCDLLILTRAGVKELDYSQIQDKFLRLLQRGNLINK
ncbi:ribonuclease P protein component [Patescibacteria group bacterium]|nr:ribonuclease P protein component [Patescibacteria group bacterium]